MIEDANVHYPNVKSFLKNINPWYQKLEACYVGVFNNLNNGGMMNVIRCDETESNQFAASLIDLQEMASTGQPAAHAPQPTQISGSITHVLPL